MTHKDKLKKMVNLKMIFDMFSYINIYRNYILCETQDKFLGPEFVNVYN